MADIWVNKSYRSWELLGTPNLVYDEIVNFDITTLPYTKKKWNTWYALEKRKWYVVDTLATVDADGVKWLTRDVIRSNVSNCSNEWYDYYLYQVSEDLQRYRVIRKTEWAPCFIDEISTGFRCECMYDRFFEAPAVGWTKRKLYGSTYESTWVASETWGTRIYDNSLTFWTWGIQIWDFLVIYNSNDDSSASLIWQVRQVIWFWTVDSNTDESGYTQYIELDPEFANWVDWQKFATWIEYQVYSKFGSTIWFVAWDGLRFVWVDKSIGSVTSWPGGESCIVSVQILNGSINYLNDRWFNFFWWIWYETMSFSANNVNPFGTNTLSTFSYKDFLLWFSRDSVSYVARTDSGDQVLIPLSEDVGIKSKYACWLFDNALVMVTRDNRLVNVWLTGNWNKLYLELQEISDFIRWDLEAMLDDDQVYIHQYDNNLYIFINSKSNHDNGKQNTTKILILDKDYKIRHKHELCSMALSWVEYGYYYGDGFYAKIWNEDIYLVWWSTIQTDVNSRISAYIGAQENDKLQDSEWNAYRLNKKKSLNWLKLLLWAGIYTDWSTIVKVDTYRNWYKFEKIFDTVEWVEWIDNWNDYFKWEEVIPSDCFIQDLDDCDNINRPCEGSRYNDTNRIYEEAPDKLACLWGLEIQKEIQINDYCVCYDSRSYALSPFYNVFLYPLSKPADLFKITLYSNGWDKLSFMGMVAEIITEDISNAVESENVIGLTCSLDTKTCPTDWC